LNQLAFFHAPWRACPKREQLVQSTLPPTRWRNEWQPNR
jgi:hypothetical protein